MINSHKRDLKTSRIIKKINTNKGVVNKKKYTLNGTGKRFLSYHMYRLYKEFLNNPFGERVDSLHAKPDQWTKRHPGQIMESDLHDRTKWKSSKKLDKIRLNNRLYKQFS